MSRLPVFGRFAARQWSWWVAMVALHLGAWQIKAQDATEAVADRVIITQRAIRHIQERHWPDSPAQGAGKFSPGITENSLKQLVDEAVTNGRMRRNTHGRPGQLYEYDFGHPIGITVDGRPAYRLRVVVNRWNQLITAFPF